MLNVNNVIMAGDRVDFHEIQRCHAAKHAVGTSEPYHSCLDEMEFASAGTASAEGLWMDSKEQLRMKKPEGTGANTAHASCRFLPKHPASYLL